MRNAPTWIEKRIAEGGPDSVLLTSFLNRKFGAVGVVEEELANRKNEGTYSPKDPHVMALEAFLNLNYAMASDMAIKELSSQLVVKVGDAVATEVEAQLNSMASGTAAQKKPRHNPRGIGGGFRV